MPFHIFLENTWLRAGFGLVVNTEILSKEYTLLPFASPVVHATLQQNNFNTTFVGNTTRVLKLPIIMFSIILPVFNLSKENFVRKTC